MTTVQHRPAPRVSFDDIPSWVWIAIAAVLAVGMGLAIGYTIADQGTTTEAAATSVEGFEYNSEATSMHLATATPVTVDYLGNSGVLYPEPVPIAPVLGFETMHEVTPMHLASATPVTAPYFGNSGELYPAVTVLPVAMGFDYDHEVTPIHVSSPDGWVTAEYVGTSGALSIEH
jgi:hypothetical protein